MSEGEILVERVRVALFRRRGEALGLAALTFARRVGGEDRERGRRWAGRSEGSREGAKAEAMADLGERARRLLDRLEARGYRVELGRSRLGPGGAPWEMEWAPEGSLAGFELGLLAMSGERGLEDLEAAFGEFAREEGLEGAAVGRREAALARRVSEARERDRAEAGEAVARLRAAEQRSRLGEGVGPARGSEPGGKRGL